MAGSNAFLVFAAIGVYFATRERKPDPAAAAS